MHSRTLVLALAVVSAPACNAINSSLLGSGSGNTDGSVTSGDSGGGGGDSSVTPPTDMLVVSYEFEDGTGAMVTDSARGLNATLSNPAMWTANGRNGKGIAMVAAIPANQYVSLPDGILTSTDDFTISAWVKLSSNPIWARIYDIGNGLPDPANRFMYLTLNGFAPGTTQSDGVQADSYGGTPSNESVIATNTFVPTGVWKHIAVTGSGGERKLYIDGFPVATLDNGPAIAPREMEPISPQSWIGKSRFDSDSGFSGSIDEFRDLQPRADRQRDRGSGVAQDGLLVLAVRRQLRDRRQGLLGSPPGDLARDRRDLDDRPTRRRDRLCRRGRGRERPARRDRRQPARRLQHGVLDLDVDPDQHGCAQQPRVRLRHRHDPRHLPDAERRYRHALRHAVSRGHARSRDSSPPIPADSTWHHVAVTMDAGNTVVLFVDGMPMKTQPSPSVHPADFANLTEAYLGRSRGQDPYFNGAIDELRIACRAFTPDEIKNLSRP